MKTCTKCHEEKALSEFNKRSKSKDGLQYRCKICSVEADKIYRKSVRGKAAYKKYRRSTSGKAILEKIQNKYRYSTQGQAARKTYGVAYRKTKDGQLKIKARSAVACALRARQLTKGPCAICFTNNSIEAHHPDYTKPLAVEWYCTMHHGEVDALKHKEENHGTEN